jgi:hypothetical protein
VHVPGGVDLHEERDGGDDEHHHGAQAVDPEADLHLEREERHPVVRLVRQRHAVVGEGGDEQSRVARSHATKTAKMVTRPARSGRFRRNATITRNETIGRK